MRLTDEELADELVTRLNGLIENEGVRLDLAKLITTRFQCTIGTSSHPTIQVDDRSEPHTVGFLGFLNGVVGVTKFGCGHIGAKFDDAGRLVGFARIERT